MVHFDGICSPQVFSAFLGCFSCFWALKLDSAVTTKFQVCVVSLNIND